MHLSGLVGGGGAEGLGDVQLRRCHQLRHKKILKPRTGFEPATSSLPRTRYTGLSYRGAKSPLCYSPFKNLSVRFPKIRRPGSFRQLHKKREKGYLAAVFSCQFINVFRPLGDAIPAKLGIDPAASCPCQLHHLLGIGQQPVYAPGDGLRLNIGQ
jgi:hypothetical protein